MPPRILPVRVLHPLVKAQVFAMQHAQTSPAASTARSKPAQTVRRTLLAQALRLADN
jgi:hypothetical protein